MDKVAVGVRMQHMRPMSMNTSLGSGRSTIFSPDHKVIGMRSSPDEPLLPALRVRTAGHDALAAGLPGPADSVVGPALGETNAPGGVMLPEYYLQLVTMHGTIMVFLASCRWLSVL